MSIFSPVFSFRLSVFCVALCAALSGLWADEPTTTSAVSEKVIAQLQQEKQWVQIARKSMEKGSTDISLTKSLHEQPIYLREAVDLALRQNFGLQITRYNPSIRADQVEVQRAAFDPNFLATATTSQTLSPMATSALEGAATPWDREEVYAVSVSQKLRTGATVSVISGMQRVEDNSAFSTLNPYYASQTGLQIVQPLLAGGGVEINLAPIAIALSSYRQSKYELRKNILDLMANTETAYWNLAANYELKALRETSVQLAKSMLDENRERARLGMVTHAEVLEAEAYLAARMESIIVAQQAIENAEDRLRELLGSLAFETADVLKPQALPQDDPGLPEFPQLVRQAMTQDYDYFIQQEEIDKRRIQLKVARNANQPALNVVAGAYGLGVDSNPGQGYFNSYNADGNTMEAGVVFSMPIGFRAERAQERMASKELDMATIQLAEVQQNLMSQVRQAWRGVAAGRQRRATTLASLELNLESYQRQHALYRAGMISFRDLLQAQTDLDNARITNLQATYDLIAANVQLQRLSGEILKHNGFCWNDAETKAAVSARAKSLGKTSKTNGKTP